VRLIPPQYVKPYVRRGKNDRNDAEGICEAAGRPGMHFVPVKSVAQQAQGMVLKVRETLVGQRTLLVNTPRPRRRIRRDRRQGAWSGWSIIECH
jgi:transposase